MANDILPRNGTVVDFPAKTMSINAAKLSVTSSHFRTNPYPTLMRASALNVVPELFYGIVGVHQNLLSGVMPSDLHVAGAFLCHNYTPVGGTDVS